MEPNSCWWPYHPGVADERLEPPVLGHADRGRSLRQAGVPAGSLRVDQRAICKCHSVDQGSGNRAGRVVGLDTLAALVVRVSTARVGLGTSESVGRCV